MNIYLARYRNALRIAARINRYLRKGYLIWDEDGDRVTGLYKLKNKDIVREERGINYAAQYSIYEHNPEYDHGYYTPIKEINKRFVGWTIVHPDHVKRLTFK